MTGFTFLLCLESWSFTPLCHLDFPLPDWCADRGGMCGGMCGDMCGINQHGGGDVERLCDEVGMGKTAVCIALILANPATPADMSTSAEHKVCPASIRVPC